MPFKPGDAVVVTCRYRGAVETILGRFVRVESGPRGPFVVVEAEGRTRKARPANVAHGSLA